MPRFDYFSNQPWFDTPGYLDGLASNTRAFFERFVAECREQWREKAPPSRTATTSAHCPDGDSKLDGCF